MGELAHQDEPKRARYPAQVLEALRTWLVDFLCDFHVCVDSPKVDVERVVKLPESIGVRN